MKNITMIIDKFDASIQKIEKSNLPQIAALNQKIKRTKDCLDELRQEVKTNSFSTTKKEIYFFKNQKPYIKGRLKFYVTICKYLLEKPVGSKSEQRKYVELQLSTICLENSKNIDFINYLILEKTKKDHLYFLRGTDQLEFFIDNTTIFEDPEFSTSRDHLAAKITANNLLNQFFTNELESLKKQHSNPAIKEIQQNPKSTIPWTGSITELVENTIALNAAGSIGNGNLSLNQIQEICINNYDINPGNIYKIFEQIKARKSNQTKFLDKLTKALINEISSQLKKL